MVCMLYIWSISSKNSQWAQGPLSKESFIALQFCWLFVLLLPSITKQNRGAYQLKIKRIEIVLVIWNCHNSFSSHICIQTELFGEEFIHKDFTLIAKQSHALSFHRLEPTQGHQNISSKWATVPQRKPFNSQQYLFKHVLL